jgi:hypothetical protein
VAGVISCSEGKDSEERRELTDQVGLERKAAMSRVSSFEL